jgi:hypothetical protein
MKSKRLVDKQVARCARYPLLAAEHVCNAHRMIINDVRQVMTGTADDVNFAAVELSCAPVPVDACTDPNLNSVNPTRLVAPFPATVRYPARRGHDWFYGYGRINMAKAVTAITGMSGWR